jgi:HAD superfamily hydrolase (TIGR01493 family)
MLDQVSPGQAVTLLLHDWGCAFGYEFATRYPDRVARIVAVDIGDYNSKALQRALSPTAKSQVWAYQVWLALAWVLGRHISARVGHRMTRWMARTLRCPAPAAQIGWQMNYPYSMRWFGLAGGMQQAAAIQPGCPLLYLYGQRKPFMFHSPTWLAQVASRPDSAVQGFKAGHWVMLDQLLPRFGLGHLSEAERQHLNRVWHRLDPWPDVVPGLQRLKTRYTLCTLSNGNIGLLTNMAKRAGLPWDCILSAEVFRAYKPDPATYLGGSALSLLRNAGVLDHLGPFAGFAFQVGVKLGR